MQSKRALALLCACLALQACGGGDDPGPSTGTVWQQGVFDASRQFEARCADPRSGNDPDGDAWPDRAGSALDEKNWLRSWTHELYLWYDEVPDVDPATRSVADYFDILKTGATTESGQPKDKFHFTYPTDAWLALSQSGQSVGYGLQWAITSTLPPRRAIVAYTEPDTPATVAGLMRGDEVMAVDGTDIDADTSAGVDILNAGLFPGAAGESHTFTIRALDGSTRDVTLQAQHIVSTPVQSVGVIAAGGDSVGYLLFNDHIATAESQLIDAMQQLQGAGVDDLVIDIRYNGGGYLAIASELAYMVAGAASTGRTFEQLEFNDQYADTNPVTGRALDPEPFLAVSQGFSGPAGVALPALGLQRVFVLTGEGTCSASESIINGLRGIGVEVIQIGSTTCGKPYGFYPADNCGTTYFSIQFRGVNAMGFGDYSDGFSPQNSTGAAGELLPGCSVSDDFTHALGDVAEGRLAEALQYRLSGTCASAPSGLVQGKASVQPARGSQVSIFKSPWHENRILRGPQPSR